MKAFDHTTPLVPLRVPVDPHPLSGHGEITLQNGAPADAEAIYTLIAEHLAEGHMLPRGLEELRVHADRFVVAVLGGLVVACGELAPLSRGVAEVRSLVVDHRARGHAVGRAIVDALQRQARIDGYRKLCAFTHQPQYFIRMGFSIVPHQWLPEKIATDCHTCGLFRQCGQYAVVLLLERIRNSFVPLSSLG